MLIASVIAQFSVKGVLYNGIFIQDPNTQSMVVVFGDGSGNPDRYEEDYRRFRRWVVHHEVIVLKTQSFRDIETYLAKIKHKR